MASTRVSFENLARTYGTLVASSSAANYPVTNLVLPNRYLGWRSVGTGVTTILIDLGAARTVDRIALIDANCRFRVEQNPTNVWTAPAYVSPQIPVSYDPQRRIYRRWWERAAFTPLTLQWTRIVISAQTPVDGAAYFRIGSLWMGTFTELPTDPKVAYDYGMVDPALSEESEHGGWGVSYTSGDAFAVHRYRRQAEMAMGTPGLGDEWGAWLDIDRQIAAAGRKCCYCVDYMGESSGVWIMQQTNPNTWSTDWPQAQDDWILREVVA